MWPDPCIDRRHGRHSLRTRPSARSLWIGRVFVCFFLNVFLLSFTQLVVALCHRRPPAGQRAAPAGRMVNRHLSGSQSSTAWQKSTLLLWCLQVANGCAPLDKYKGLNFELTYSIFVFTWEKNKQQTHLFWQFWFRSRISGMNHIGATKKYKLLFSPYICTQLSEFDII